MIFTWKEYSKRKAIFFFAVIVFFVCSWIGTRTIGLPIVGFVVGVFVVLCAAIYLVKFKCPRCHNSFVLNGAYGNVLTSKCLNCGLRAYASAEEINSDTYSLKQ